MCLLGMAAQVMAKPKKCTHPSVSETIASKFNVVKGGKVDLASMKGKWCSSTSGPLGAGLV